MNQQKPGYMKKRFSLKRLRQSEVEYVFSFKEHSVLVHASGENMLTSIPLRRLEMKMREQPFMRIHRTFLVNLNRIRLMEVSGSQFFVHVGRHKLPVARRKRKILMEVMDVV